jgi:hypothetical protein
MAAIKKITAALVIAVLLALAAAPVYGATVNADGPTYWGTGVMAVNTAPISQESDLKPANYESVGIWEKTPAENALQAAASLRLPPCCATPRVSLSAPVPGNLPAADTLSAQETQAYKIGDVRDNWTWIDTGYTKVSMTCVGIGTHCTIWADGPGTLAQADIDEYIRTFDGAYDAMVEDFGSPQELDVDNDGKTALVYSLLPGTFVGYFSELNLYSEAVVGEGGMGMDILHMTLPHEGVDKHVIATTEIHEFQHLINKAMVGDQSDAWLNEVLSQNAEKVTDVGMSASDLGQDAYEAWVVYAFGFTTPVVYQGNYVPNDPFTALSYPQWYYFGRYLSAQTRGYAGGGDRIFKTILDNGACTTDSLVKVLTEMGYLGRPGVEDLDALLRNYNLALYYQEPSGLYSFGGEDIFFRGKAVFKQLGQQDKLPGGGAATYAAITSDGVTPRDYGAHIRFIGLDGAAPVPSPATEPAQQKAAETVSANVPTGIAGDTAAYGQAAVLAAAGLALLALWKRRWRE